MSGNEEKLMRLIRCLILGLMNMWSRLTDLGDVLEQHHKKCYWIKEKHEFYMTHLAWLRTITEIVTFYTSRHLFDRTKVKKNNNNEKNNHELSIKKKIIFLKTPFDSTIQNHFFTTQCWRRLHPVMQKPKWQIPHSDKGTKTIKFRLSLFVGNKITWQL